MTRKKIAGLLILIFLAAIIAISVFYFWLAEREQPAPGENLAEKPLTELERLRELAASQIPTEEEIAKQLEEASALREKAKQSKPLSEEEIQEQLKEAERLRQAVRAAE